MKKIYIWEKNGVLNSTNWNLYLDEEWIIEVEVWTWQENLCKDYKLKDLYELYNKYFSNEIESLKINLENENILKEKIKELEDEIEKLKSSKKKVKTDNLEK